MNEQKRTIMNEQKTNMNSTLFIFIFFFFFLLAIVISPTRELSLQIFEVLKQIAHSCAWIVPGKKNKKK